MALLLKNGSFFFHVPKTGGTWVSYVLRQSGCVVGQIGHKHCYPSEIGLSPKPLWHPSQWRDRFRIRYRASSPIDGWLFLRDPVSWYKSWYFYQEKRGWVCFGSSGFDNAHPLEALNFFAKHPPGSFDEYVRVICERCPQFLSLMYLKFLNRNQCRVLPYGSLVSETRDLLTEEFELEKSYVEDLCKVPARNVSDGNNFKVSSCHANIIYRNESIYYDHPKIFEGQNNEIKQSS